MAPSNGLALIALALSIHVRSNLKDRQSSVKICHGITINCRTSYYHARIGFRRITLKSIGHKLDYAIIRNSIFMRHSFHVESISSLRCKRLRILRKKFLRKLWSLPLIKITKKN